MDVLGGQLFLGPSRGYPTFGQTYLLNAPHPRNCSGTVDIPATGQLPVRSGGRGLHMQYIPLTLHQKLSSGRP